MGRCKSGGITKFVLKNMKKRIFNQNTKTKHLPIRFGKDKFSYSSISTHHRLSNLILTISKFLERWFSDCQQTNNEKTSEVSA